MPKKPNHIAPTDDDELANWVESDDFDPAPGEFVDAEPLRRVAAAVDALERADRQVASEVATARDAGLSWTVIAAALGVSRQAARQRFADSARR
jgi:hypothetical protein